jgi:hypothetical protein
LKDEAGFTWGMEQQITFDKIRNICLTPSVLKVSNSGAPFWLYVAKEDDMIGVILTQETERKKHIIIYVSRRILEAETRHHFLENYAFRYTMLVQS